MDAGSDEAIELLGDYFHYTNMSGLIGILQSKEIWLTDIRFLNDAMEFHYYIEILMDCFKDRSGDLDNRLREECESSLYSIENIQNDLRIYVASFSENGDSLPQWRGYGSEGGFNIGFHADELQSTMSDSVVHFKKVNYSLAEAKKAASLSISNLIRACQAGERESYFSDFISEVFRDACLFKDPSFASEQEWRLVKYSNITNSDELYLREGAEAPIPYIKVSLVDGGTGNFIASSVNTGPSMNFETNKQVFGLFKKRYTYYSFKLGCSKIPFRST
ncbi:MAG: DUF2971 domain-containing protein [Saccharospirillum sp.]|uniref:DUF2971 domain-containing protein n=1 Tax=Saccharospirillum sp. TaxID=2033801 RepID=UPI003298BAD0